ncbi:MAG: hypothetical protein M0036_01810, partial [Desulfobacteraceae bacterium]|nr:hypothetical protein [Desulfobacteraceae bacterium]
MEEISQIRIGKHMTGIVGLKAALQDAMAACRGLTDEEIGKLLVERLSKHNYIEAGARPLYVEAFIGEYKRSRGEPIPEPAAAGLEI